MAEKEKQLPLEDRAIQFFTDKSRSPGERLLGEYVIFHERGTLNVPKVRELIKEIYKDDASVTRNPGGELLVQGLVTKYFEARRLYTVADAKMQRKAQYPREINEYLFKIINDVVKEDKEASVTAAQSPDVVNILHLMSRAMNTKEEQSARPLNQLEKNRFVQDEYGKYQRIFNLNDDPNSGDLPHRTDPLYRGLVKRAEVMDVQDIKKNEQPLTREQLEGQYLVLVKDLDKKVKKFLTVVGSEDPYTLAFEQNPFNGEKEIISRDQDGKAVIITAAHATNYWEALQEYLDIVKVTDRNTYNEFINQFYLLNVLREYILTYEDVTERETRIEEIEKVLVNPADFLSLPLDNIHIPKTVDEMARDSSGYFGMIVNEIQRLESTPVLEGEADSKDGFLGKKKGWGKIANEILRKKVFGRASEKILHSFAPTTQELGGVLDVITDQLDIKSVMTGNPAHLARFPGGLSVMPEEMREKEEFRNYTDFSQAVDLSAKVHVKNTIPLSSNQTRANAFVYLALPQYAPIASLYIRSGNTELQIGNDIELQYGKKTGHYRLRLLSERAQQLAQQGITYDAGLDYITKQPELPKRVEQVQLNPEKISTVCESLRQAGFDRLANRLEKSLQPNLKKKMRGVFTGEKPLFTSSDVAHAIRDSIYYSFKTKENDPDLQVATQVVGASVDGELDFSFLPRNISDNQRDRIQVQCGNVAKLYGVLLNALMNGEMMAYQSSLLVDPFDGLTSVLGVKIFTGAHSDTRAVIQGEEELQRFDQDLTPGISLRSAVDAVKSLFQSKKSVDENLSDTKKRLEKKKIERIEEKNPYLGIIWVEDRFNLIVTELKKEVALASPDLAKVYGGIDDFVARPPGAYRQPEELLEVLKKKPLSATMNAVLYLQDKGLEGLKNTEKREALKKTMKTETELYQQLQNRDEDPRRRQYSDAVFVEDLNNAARVAEKMLLIIEAYEQAPKVAETPDSSPEEDYTRFQRPNVAAA